MGARRVRRRGVPIPTASTPRSAGPCRPVRLEVSGLSKSFGPVQAVSDLSFTVEPGSVTGFLGPNGAGKTTTLRMVLGLMTPDARDGDFDGTPYAALPDARCARWARCSRPPSTRRASGRNHLRVYCRAAGIPRRPGRRGARPGRPGRRGRPAGRRLLPGHAPAARAGDGAARRPRRPRARRAGQRAGPRGHPVAARLPPAPGPRAGPHGAGVQPPAVRGGADGRPRGHRRRRPAGARGHAWSSCGPAPTARARCSSAARRWRGSPRCSRRRRQRLRRRTASSPSRGRTPSRSATAPSRQASNCTNCAPHTSGLEEIYFQLTSGQEQFAAARRHARARRPPDDRGWCAPSGPSCSPPACGSGCCSAPA